MTTNPICPDPTQYPGGTLFVVEDGTWLPVAPPTPAPGEIWVMTVTGGVNSNFPYWDRLKTLLAAVSPPPPPMAPPPHLPFAGDKK